MVLLLEGRGWRVIQLFVTTLPFFFFQILTIRQILEGVLAKNLEATILFVEFTKAFDSIHRGKMEQILLTNSLPKETATADYAVLLTNAPTQAKTLLQSLEQAAAGIGFHVNTCKTEYMCFNQRGDFSTLNGSSLKLVDKFTTYLWNSVSSTDELMAQSDDDDILWEWIKWIK